MATRFETLAFLRHAPQRRVGDDQFMHRSAHSWRRTCSRQHTVNDALKPPEHSNIGRCCGDDWTEEKWQTMCTVLFHIAVAEIEPARPFLGKRRILRRKYFLKLFYKSVAYSACQCRSQSHPRASNDVSLNLRHNYVTVTDFRGVSFCVLTDRPPRVAVLP